MSAEIIIEPDVASVVSKLSKIIQETANASIERDGLFKIGLSGGSLVQLLRQGLPGVVTDWTKWRFFFCDERIVPFDDGDSTWGVYRENLIGCLPVNEGQFVTVRTDLTPEDAADDYAERLTDYFPIGGLPRFDLLLLGMGPDGHTCSLFPGHAALDEKTRWVSAVKDSPKPPPVRVTLTLPVVNNAAVCVFAVAGAAKADMVQRIWKLGDDLPATRVRPTDGKLIVILDKEAAAKMAD